MSQCGVSIPLDDIVEAIIDSYGTAFVDEILKRLNERCDTDNYAISFKIDKIKDHLVIDMKHGESYAVSRAELESWLKFSCGTTIVKPGADVYVTGGQIQDNHLLVLERNDGQEVPISFADWFNNIHTVNTYVISGMYTLEDDKPIIDLTRNDGVHVKVDMTDAIAYMTNIVYERVMKIGYRVNTQADNYSLATADFDGRTIVRADKNGDQTITITKPADETFVGKAIIVRKTNGAAGTFVDLATASGVTLSPPDATPLRRVGSSVTLVYVGNGVYDVFGELP